MLTLFKSCNYRSDLSVTGLKRHEILEIGIFLGIERIEIRHFRIELFARSRVLEFETLEIGNFRIGISRFKVRLKSQLYQKRYCDLKLLQNFARIFRLGVLKSTLLS